MKAPTIKAFIEQFANECEYHENVQYKVIVNADKEHIINNADPDNIELYPNEETFFIQGVEQEDESLFIDIEAITSISYYGTPV